jgi:leucyl aminopeptidase
MPITFTATKDVPEDAEVLAVPVFEGGELPPGSPVELDAGFLAARDFEGKPGQVQALLSEDGSTILAVGVGMPEAVDAEALRRAASAVVKGAWRAQRVATTLLDAAPADLDRAAAAQAIAEGASLAAYRFVTYKSDKKLCAVESVAVVTGARGGANVQKALNRGERIATAVKLARDLVNEPPTSMRPVDLEAAARWIADAEDGLELEVWDEKRIRAEGLGGLAGVAAGSDEPPRLLRMTYNPKGARGSVALVGKGITFDSGGLSIKSGEGMMTMKCDMAGAAVVLATMSALPALGVKTRVVGYAACTENLPSGKATKPGDVLRIRNGKTVEVLNTDAEGRLVLADALSLAVEDKPDAIIDLATLTGAVSIALGPDIAGVMGNDDALIDDVRAASDRAGEPTWQLPLPARYRKYIDSEVADIKNIGQGNKGGTLTAGLFLKEFVGDRPWVHIDLAGPAFRDNEDAYLPKGGTGYGVRTMLELLSTYRAPTAARGRR